MSKNKATKNKVVMPNCRKNVEDIIFKKYRTGNIASKHASRKSYLIDSGILSLNLALGTNGLLGGRMSLFWGKRGTSKTMITLCTCGQVQRDGGKAAFLDPEGTFDHNFAKMLGVNLDNLYLVTARDAIFDDDGNVLPPLSGEQWFDIVNMLIHSGSYNFIVMDSITACVPQAIFGKENIDQNAIKGAQAQMTSSMLQKTNAYLTSSPHCHFAMIAQARDNINIMFGASSKPSGGNSPGFYVSYEIECKKVNTYREKLPISSDYPDLRIDQDVGIDLRLRITKNKVARIMEPAEFYVDLRTGVSQEIDVIKTAKKLGVLERNGSQFKFDDKKWNGEAAVVDAIKVVRKLYDKIRLACLDTLGIKYTDLTDLNEEENVKSKQVFKV